MLFLPEPGMAQTCPFKDDQTTAAFECLGLLGLPSFQGQRASQISLPLCFSTQLFPQTQGTINNEQSSFLRLQAYLPRSVTLAASPLL